MFNLNRVGSRILELLESGAEEPKIVDVISQEFNGKPELVGKEGSMSPRSRIIIFGGD